MPDSLTRWDPTGLRRVLAMAGPADAALILHHLNDDLATAARALDTALAQDNLEAIRRSIHALVALCGTAGAACLHQKACDLRDQIDAGLSADTRILARSLQTGAAWLAERVATELGA